jgi:hypothetical protein
MRSREEQNREGSSRQEADSRQLAELVERAANRAVQGAIGEHHLAGAPVAIWRDGQVVLVHPDGSVQTSDSGDAPPEDRTGR